MGYDGLRYIKAYSTGASASSLRYFTTTFGLLIASVLFLYNVCHWMDPNLKKRIIDEAYRLFIIKGIKHTSFCDIAIAVHKSKGAVMHYFPSKKQLVNTVVEKRFIPASQLSPEIKLLSYKEWSEFIRHYKNPIERAIHDFPGNPDGIGLLHYMQFISSASEYMNEFPQIYQKLLEEEQAFLLNVTSKAVTKHNLIISDIQLFSRQTFEMSIGNTFLKLISFN